MRETSSSAIAARHILTSGNPDLPPSGTTRNYTFRAQKLSSEILKKVSAGYLSIPAAERLLVRGDDSQKAVDAFNGAVFDPVLCELAYLWFCPPGGIAYDPFAGSAVSGIVASKLGVNFVGVEIREGQVAKNTERAEALDIDPRPQWLTGSSMVPPGGTPGEVDFCFSCPPYFDLQVYSDDPGDLSAMSFSDFLSCYREVVADCAARLKQNRYACFVVGDVRDKDGNYRGLIGKTVDAFHRAGMSLYNEMILVEPPGSLPVRSQAAFKSSRKIGKRHQNVLIFVKGSAKRAVVEIGALRPPANILGCEKEFGVSPMSVLNTHQGWWVDRRRAWMALGLGDKIELPKNQPMPIDRGWALSPNI